MKNVDDEFILDCKTGLTIVQYPNQPQEATRETFNNTEVNLMSAFTVSNFLGESVELSASLIFPNFGTGIQTKIVSIPELKNGRWWRQEQGEKLPF